MSLAQHVPSMTNRELNGLAQNRFIDGETQVAIATHAYLRCRQYLALNRAILPVAKDVLLAGRARSVQWNLVQSGNLNESPDLIAKIYKEIKEE